MKEEEDSHISLLTLVNHPPQPTVWVCASSPGWRSTGSCWRTTHLLPAPKAPMLGSSPGRPRGHSASGGVLLQHWPQKGKKLPSLATLALPFPAPPLLPNLLLTPNQGGCRFSGAGRYRLDCICLGINNLLLDGQSEFN